MKSFLVLLDNEYKPDPRVKKHLDCLLYDMIYEVHLICTKSDKNINDESHPNLHIHRILDHGKIHQYYKNSFVKELDAIEKIIKDNEIKNILANDHICLEISCQLKRRLSYLDILYDAHEFIAGWPYYQYEKKWVTYFKGALVHKLFCYKEWSNLKKISSLITVSEGLKKEYLKLCPGINAGVVRNIPPSFETEDDLKVDYRKKIGVLENQQVLIHSGNLYYKDHVIDFLLKNISEFKDDWKILFLIKNTDQLRITDHRDYKSVQDKILFHDFVPYKDLKQILSIASAGLILNYKPEWKSHWYSLPNRIFDYIHADLPILSTKQPEFKKIIDTFNIGVTFDISKNITTLKNSFQKIIDQKQKFNDRLKIAQKEMIWEKEKMTFLKIIKKHKNE